jgi:hypothetical protein
MAELDKLLENSNDDDDSIEAAAVTQKLLT